MQAADGDLYGVAGGGTNCNPYGCGTVFRITTAGKLTTLHSFNGADGNDPSGALVQSTDGNFYGTTGLGGTSSTCTAIGGCGTVFKITPGGKLTTIYSFCAKTKCADGANPSGGLIFATDGNFYGTTYGGGDTGAGTVFKITPGGRLTTLHTFCEQTRCPDGAVPMGGMVQDTNGAFYGTTSGGYDVYGTVFSLSTGLGPFVAFVRDSRKVGGNVGILGQGFKGTTAVSFNGTAASFKVVSATYIIAIVPKNATTGFVTVATLKRKLKSNVKFRVIE